MNNHHIIDRPSTLAAACANGVAGVLIFAVLPMLLGVVAEHLQLDDIKTGFLASGYFGAFALVNASSVFWIRRINWRIISSIGLLLMAGGLILAMLLNTYEGVLFSMTISGVGAAMALPLSYTIVSDRTEKDRDFAIKLIPEQLVPAILILLLSSFFIETIGFFGFLTTLTVMIVALLFFAPWVPTEGREHQSATQHAKVSGMAVFIALIALFVYFLGFTGIWAFLERIANEGKLAKDVTGQLLALGLLCSAIGPFIAVLVADRFGRLLPLAIAAVGTVTPLLLLGGDLTVLKYGLVMATLPTAWYFGSAYFFGIIADADTSGRFSCLISFALAIGALVGPPLFGYIKTSSHINTAFGFSAVAIIAGVMFILWANRLAGATPNSATERLADHT